MRILKFLPGIFLVLYLLLVFKQFFINGLLPVPADTIVGMYHPWRDLYAKDYPNGIPMKNTLITDAVRQGYVWRDLAITQLKASEIPVWNPYSFSGYPLLANFQSAAFYPLNFIYWLTSFSIGWSLQVVSQVLLGGIFMWLFLKNIKLRDEAVAMGVIAWVGSGFFVSWLETNIVIQSLIWLPLIFLAIDKVLLDKRNKWLIVLFSGVIFSFLAGHLQTTFYVVVACGFYALSKIRFVKKPTIGLFILLSMLSILILSPLIFSQFQFIGYSARDLISKNWQQLGWFIPFANFVQFFAPDFWGNPATGNYFGVWNYGEFVGYVGIIPLIFSLFGWASIRKEKYFYIGLLVIALIFAFPNFISEIPFRFNFPMISSSMPTRLLGLIDFALVVLAAFGADWFLTHGKIKRSVFIVLGLMVFYMTIFWLAAIGLKSSISLRNLYLPTGVFFLSMTLIILGLFKSKLKLLIFLFLLVITLFDLGRFANKYLSFSPAEYLFPKTKVTDFLKNNIDNFRISSVDERIMPGNFSVIYKLQTISGYDPLYLRRYAEFTGAMDKNRPDITSALGYDRIITPKNYDSKFFSLLGVKYVLSLDDINSLKYKKVFQEGQTKVYENVNVFPRAYFVSDIQISSDKQTSIDKMFNANLLKTAIVENYFRDEQFNPGKVSINKYSPNEILLQTQNDGVGFLVLTDIYYPSWKAEIDGVLSKIYLTDYTFRGIIIPKGNHNIRFFVTL